MAGLLAFIACFLSLTFEKVSDKTVLSNSSCSATAGITQPWSHQYERYLEDRRGPASIQLFSCYSSILIKSILIFLFHQLNNIAEITVQCFANLSENLCADMLILAQLGKSSGRNTCSQAQILLFHILINQEFPQFIVANGHNNTSCAGFILTIE